MFRRIVTILVITGFVATQWAATPHVHAFLTAAQQREHDATGHIHLHGHGVHHHGHSHVHPRHRHENDESLISEESNEAPLGSVSEQSGHDSDAVYSVTQVLSTAKAQKVPVDQPCLQFVVWDLKPIRDSAANGSIPWHPPDGVSDGSDRYLALRTLRI